MHFSFSMFFLQKRRKEETLKKSFLFLIFFLEIVQFGFSESMILDVFLTKNGQPVSMEAGVCVYIQNRNSYYELLHSIKTDPLNGQVQIPIVLPQGDYQLVVVAYHMSGPEIGKKEMNVLNCKRLTTSLAIEVNDVDLPKKESFWS